MPKLIAVALIAAVLGGILGAVVYAVAFDTDSDTDDAAVMGERGALIHMGPLDGFREIDTTPFCVPSQHFCLVHLESGELRALYTYDPHPWFRERGCDLPWRPDFSFSDPATGETTQGWFRSGCSGATFRYDGTLVFGPSPRDMDQYPVTMEKAEDGDVIVVDTRSLICGRNRSSGGTPADCVKAPPPQ
jgi:hypothetical protein